MFQDIHMRDAMMRALDNLQARRPLQTQFSNIDVVLGDQNSLLFGGSKEH